MSLWWQATEIYSDWYNQNGNLFEGLLDAQGLKEVDLERTGT